MGGEGPISTQISFCHAFLLSHQDSVELKRKKTKKKVFFFLNILKIVKSFVTVGHLVICLNLGQVGRDPEVCFDLNCRWIKCRCLNQ